METAAGVDERMDGRASRDQLFTVSVLILPLYPVYDWKCKVSPVTFPASASCAAYTGAKLQEQQMKFTDFSFNNEGLLVCSDLCTNVHNHPRTLFKDGVCNAMKL